MTDRSGSKLFAKVTKIKKTKVAANKEIVNTDILN